MDINEYQTWAMSIINPDMTQKDRLINSVMGLCGESGEAVDIVKKWLHQGHDFDREHFIRELGDIAWYLAEAATAVDASLEEILQGNRDKLTKRYPNGFEVDRSRNRTE